METSELKHARRRFQFGLSALFCVTLLVAIWAWGTRILAPDPGLGDPSYVRNFAWIEFTGIALILVLLFMRAAVRRRQFRAGGPAGNSPGRETGE
jgi:hypothetical protein